MKDSGKLPGKTEYAGRRRPMTRKSGFSAHGDSTGSSFRRAKIPTLIVDRNNPLEVRFEITGHGADTFVGFGGYFQCDQPVAVRRTGGPRNAVLTEFPPGSWNKFGSLWKPSTNDAIEVQYIFSASERAEIAIHDLGCGAVKHTHLTNSRDELLGNMHSFAPEANFYDDSNSGDVTTSENETGSTGLTLIEKSCNRCARFLPVNVPHERNQLSFTNHCVAAHRRPCSHTGFGSPKNAEDESDVLNLEYGFQLECRFCKKFEVNAAHNPQRSASQMKEDGARRRAMEYLLEHLYKGTPQLIYRQLKGTELTDDVWKRFGGKCFRCGVKLESKKKMHLDHTRPLKYLWPLDGSATALCANCNNEKRDRAPADFYTDEQLESLSALTGLSKKELESTAPNENALTRLINDLDWFFDTFLTKPEMQKVREGKETAELVVKALQKVVSESTLAETIDLQQEFDKRRAT
jgi:hypothetical protein